MRTHSTKLDVKPYIDKVGIAKFVQLLQYSLNSLSIDLHDQFCFANEIKHQGKHTVIITGSDEQLVEEVLYQLYKQLKDFEFSLEYSSPHYEYSLGA